MPNFDENFFSTTRSPSLYCVWVSMCNHAGDRLAAIWIDPAMTAFQSCAPEASHEIDKAATHLAGHQEADVHLSAGEPRP